MSNAHNYNFCRNPDGDSIIRQAVSTIREGIDSLKIAKYSLFLGGSYGRGEGATALRGSTLRPVNDIDLYIITEQKLPLPKRRALKRLAKDLAQKLDVPHLDLMPLTAKELTRSPLSMHRFDLLAGYRFMGGELKIATPDHLPDPPFPPEEIRNLLINRGLTLLEGHPSLGMSQIDQARKISKGIWAIVDAILFERGRYATSYAMKRSEISRIPDIDPLTKDMIEWATGAFYLSLNEEELKSEKILDLWGKTMEGVIKSLLKISSKIDGKNYTEISELFPFWRGRSASRALPSGVASMILLRPLRRRVEKAIFNQLTNTPTDLKELESWPIRSKKLIKAWYDS